MACLYVKTLWSSYYDVTSVDFNSKKNPRRLNFRPTKYITIFLRSIQRLQIFKIPKYEIGTLNYEFALLVI